MFSKAAKSASVIMLFYLGRKAGLDGVSRGVLKAAKSASVIMLFYLGRKAASALTSRGVLTYY